jgi:hypothetical protein
VERFGGFAGISRVWSLDTDDLDPDAAARLHALVDDLHAAGLPPNTPEPGSPGAPPVIADAFGYDVTVRRGQRRWQVLVREDQDGAPLRALIEYVRGVPDGS